jgi:hypothetical protein
METERHMPILLGESENEERRMLRFSASPHLRVLELKVSTRGKLESKKRGAGQFLWPRPGWSTSGISDQYSNFRPN